MERMKGWVVAYLRGVPEAAFALIDALDDWMVIVLTAVAVIACWFAPPWLLRVVIFAVVMPLVVFIVEMILTFVWLENAKRNGDTLYDR